MRRLAAIPLALLLGCWDFESLSGTYVPPIIDASVPGDIACAKTPNSLLEDCTQNGDINNNCLVGCEDPTCADHVACFGSKGYKTYGAVVATAGMCPGQSMQSPVYQGLTKPASCNGSCSCTGATTSCRSMLHVYPTATDCTNKTNDLPVNIAEGANLCPAVTSVKDSYYSVDKLAPGTCTARAPTTVALTPSWGTTNVLCDQQAMAGSSKLLRFADMKANSVACVIFDGTDTSVCASTKLYPNARVFYTDTSGTSGCMCTCAAAGGCALTNGATNLVNLTDRAACGATTNLFAIKADSKCEQAVDGMARTFQSVAVSTNLAGPACTATGTVTGGFTAIGGFTACCAM